ncbi:hypothetical protein LEWO105114_09225 [Legionella worsleiensis]|uniref:Uncharacterized protein n=1 Tax=Legionella worsleiensis TaxID=45076 RepID=A0A0W1AIJ7_9GAMM|nr:hypothetical protein Lwor_0877 [Legionella worsleiensis]STY33175.1 Uncharacterised protein [Legionella worsleiensis]
MNLFIRRERVDAGQTHLNYEHKSPPFCLRPVLYAQEPCDLSAGKDLDSAHKAQNVGVLVLDNTFRCFYPAGGRSE